MVRRTVTVRSTLAAASVARELGAAVACRLASVRCCVSRGHLKSNRGRFIEYAGYRHANPPSASRCCVAVSRPRGFGPRAEPRGRPSASSVQARSAPRKLDHPSSPLATNGRRIGPVFRKTLSTLTRTAQRVDGASGAMGPGLAQRAAIVRVTQAGLRPVAGRSAECRAVAQPSFSFAAELPVGSS
jgi:hypothetical protein